MSARGRTASRGGGVSYKCTDGYRRAPSQVERGADREGVVDRCAADSEGVVVGRCTAFCPAKELKLRVRERLLSKYEVGGEGLRPVKEYSRPAAG